MVAHDFRMTGDWKLTVLHKLVGSFSGNACIVYLLDSLATEVETFMSGNGNGASSGNGNGAHAHGNDYKVPTGRAEWIVKRKAEAAPTGDTNM
jgi:hypothetical protein